MGTTDHRWSVLRTQSSVLLGPQVVLRMRSEPGVPPGDGEQRAEALGWECTTEQNDDQPKKFPLRGLEEISGNQLRSPWQIISKIKIKYSNISAFRYIPKRLIFSFNFILAAFKTLAYDFQKRRLEWGGGGVRQQTALPTKAEFWQRGSCTPGPPGWGCAHRAAPEFVSSISPLI